jgi:cellulose synthase/poly-beta-1,6-N-acetylglucosamine synthase-like glycosyltransferase
MIYFFMGVRPHESQVCSAEHPLPQISAIIPARNEEATIEAAVRSLGRQTEIAEIIVVNDHSTDRTGEILARLAEEISKLIVLSADGLPDGWVGKNNAAWLGAQAAKSEWLLFTDADTMHLAGSAKRALADAAASGAALVSYSPEQVTKSFAERALIPFIYCRLARKFDYGRVNDRALLDAAANGQFLVIRRNAYDAIGGHRAVAGEILEDVALARRAKRAGYCLYFASGEGIARTRMYRSFGAMWHGWTKNLYPLLGGSGEDVARELLATFPWLSILSFAAAILIPGNVRLPLLALGIVALGIRHAAYGRQLLLNRYPRKLIAYYAPACFLYAAVALASAWNYQRGRVVWSGRTYPVGGRG